MSRQNLRKTYIDKGKLSVSMDAQGKPYIELTECFRVFPDRFKLSDQDEGIVGNPVVSGFQELLQKNEALTTELQMLRDRLQAEAEQRRNSEEREAWLRNHVDKLTEENLKLLGAPSTKKSGWLSDLFGK